MTGFVNVFKAEGVSSTYCVNRLKRLFSTPCGHMGTLDPLASGVLPIGVGNATRLFEYFLDKEKTYIARFRFGATTATLDRESEVIEGGRIPTDGEIKSALPHLTGELLQIPPAYSAKSVGGVRSYELARKGKTVELAPKRVEVKSFTLMGQRAPEEYEFEIVCGGGTYIRSLARDLGELLGTKAYMTMLRREKSGVFTAETSVPLESLTEKNVHEYLIPTDSVLPFPEMKSDDKRLLNGMSLPSEYQDGVYKFYFEESFYGLARVQAGQVKLEKKLC